MAVISYGFWQRHYGGAADATFGRMLRNEILGQLDALVHGYSCGRAMKTTARRMAANGSVPASASGTRRMAALQLAPAV